MYNHEKDEISLIRVVFTLIKTCIVIVNVHLPAFKFHFFFNRSGNTASLALRDPSTGYVNIDLAAHTIQTVLWWSS